MLSSPEGRNEPPTRAHHLLAPGCTRESAGALAVGRAGALPLLRGLKKQDSPAWPGHEAPAWLSACVVGGLQGGSPGAPTHMALGSGRPPGRGLHLCHGGRRLAKLPQNASHEASCGDGTGQDRPAQVTLALLASVPGRPRAEAVDEDVSQACHAQAPAPWPLASWKEGGEGRDALAGGC